MEEEGEKERKSPESPTTLAGESTHWSVTIELFGIDDAKEKEAESYLEVPYVSFSPGKESKDKRNGGMRVE